jgi:hypothetical protein
MGAREHCEESCSRFDAPALLGRRKQPSRAPMSARSSSLESLSPQLSNAPMQATNRAPQQYTLHSNVKLCRFFIVKACSPWQDVIPGTDDDERWCVEKLTTLAFHRTIVSEVWSSWEPGMLDGSGSVQGFENLIVVQKNMYLVFARIDQRSMMFYRFGRTKMSWTNRAANIVKNL